MGTWQVQAAEIINSDDLKLSWNNTFKYSAASRLEAASPKLLADPNQDDGDRNFGKGLISNRVDWLTEANLTKGNLGARISAAAWYDRVYNSSNDNNFAPTFNPASVSVGRFPEDVRKLHGRKAEILDAYVFGSFHLGEMPADLRVGKHTVVFGETLFFGGNGIAAAQAPVDAIKLLSVPNTQFKELLMPVPQLSGQLQISEKLTAAAYYQTAWKRTRVPAAGSYFSTLDVLDAGGERFLTPGGPMPRGADVQAKDSGQGGVALRWRPDGHDAEYGFYAVRYHDKTPQLYVNAPLGQYQLVYPEGVRSYGASFSTVLEGTNVAGELSWRENAPLVSDAQVVFGANDNASNPAYAVGRSLHLNLSAIHSWQKTALFDNAMLMAEVGINRLQSITKNAAALDPNTARTAWGVRMLFEPNYYQVVDGWDLSLPIGLGYNPKGNSAVVGTFNGGVNKGGDFSIGVKGTYLGNLKASLNYTRYLGSQGTTLTPTPAGYQFSFKQSMADRDFVSLSVQYSF